MTQTLDLMQGMPSMGAGQAKEARAYIKRFCLPAEIMMAFMSLLTATSAPLITSLSGVSPESAELTFRLLLLVSAGKLTLWVTAFRNH